MDITIIVAIAENNAIGKNNDLLWHISGDLKRFKEITTGHTIIMGRKTYLSLPKRPLPNRRSIVISDIPNENMDGVEITNSIESAISLADKEKENFIIGGGMIYKQFLPIANKIYLTKVHKTYDADIFFPEINIKNWNITEVEEHKDQYPPFSYITLVRK